MFITHGKKFMPAESSPWRFPNKRTLKIYQRVANLLMVGMNVKKQKNRCTRI